MEAQEADGQVDLGSKYKVFIHKGWLSGRGIVPIGLIGILGSLQDPKALRHPDDSELTHWSFAGEEDSRARD